MLGRFDSHKHLSHDASPTCWPINASIDPVLICTYWGWLAAIFHMHAGVGGGEVGKEEEEENTL